MEVQKRNNGLNYRKTFSRTYYEDIQSFYEACKEIIKTERSSHDNWFGNNVVQLFEKTTRESLAQIKNWSKDEFSDRKKENLDADK